MQNLQPNPYQPQQPIRSAEKFFGRADSLAWLTQHLLQHALIAVHGPPRIGVSSFLLTACQQLSGSYQATYILLAGQTPAQTMQQIARVLSVATGLPSMDSTQSLQAAFSDSIHDTQRKPVLLALDGLAAWEQRAKIELVNALALLAATNSTLRFLLGWGVLADDNLSRDMPLRLEGLADNLTPLAQLKLGPLSRLESSELLTGTAGELLKYDYNALERLMTEANGRPHALQTLGHAAYERRALQKRVYTRDAQQAIDDAIAPIGQDMTQLWQQLTRNEQLVLAAAATMRGEHGLLTLHSLLLEFAAHRIELSPEQAREALAALLQLDVCETMGAGSFRFSHGLIRDWAVQHASLPVVTGRTPKPQWRPVTYTPRRRIRILPLLTWVILLAAFGAALFSVVTNTPVAGLIGLTTPTPTLTATTAPPLITATRQAFLTLIPPTPRPQPVIAYMSRKTTSEKWRIYVAEDNGVNARPLTSGLADDQWPQWSPDGSKIVFSSNRDGNWEIYVMNADGADQRRLTRTPSNDWYPNWSPDGQKIVFNSNRDRNWEIYSMNADGSSVTRLSDNPAEDWSPAWSPDGRVIAFASKRDGNQEIYVMNPDGSVPTRLTQTNANNISPVWSPEGRRMLFESNRDGNWEIYAMDGDGNHVKNLSNNLAADRSPAWFWDGGWIAFESNRSGTFDIWIMRVDGSDPRNWTFGAGIAQAPAWRPNAKKPQTPSQ